MACQNQRRLFKLHALILNHKSSESNFVHVHLHVHESPRVSRHPTNAGGLIGMGQGRVFGGQSPRASGQSNPRDAELRMGGGRSAGAKSFHLPPSTLAPLQPLFPLKTDCAGAQAPKPQSPEGIPQRSGGV